MPGSFRWPYYDDDLVVWIDPANAIERSMLLGYDPDVVRAVQRFVGPGLHCIDVGANVGAVTLSMAKRVGPAGRVLAVEPGPPYVERLRDNIAANPALEQRVTIEAAGLSDAEGTLLWKPDPAHPYNAGMSAAHPSPMPGELPVRVTTMDALVVRQGWERVDFVKIDVEGMELEVLRGARETLGTRRPVVLFETMEVFRTLRREQTGQPDVFADIERSLQGLGYALYDLQADGNLKAVTAASLPDNTLAIPRERSFSAA
jgi:FkbM family methyltransferase